MTVKVGSLFSGYGGLDLGVKNVIKDSKVVWHSEIEHWANEILDFQTLL